MHLPALLTTRRASCCLTAIAWLVLPGACATTKTSDNARTGVEQLLISSATDQALDKVDFEPVRGAKVYVETKYLDCTDKNYIILAVHQRLLRRGSTLVDKPEDAQVILEVGSGGVGTDRHDFFVGIPAIPLPPPSPIAVPKMEQPVINSGTSLARADYKQWNFMGSTPSATGRVPDELKAATGESEAFVPLPRIAAGQKSIAR